MQQQAIKKGYIKMLHLYQEQNSKCWTNNQKLRPAIIAIQAFASKMITE